MPFKSKAQMKAAFSGGLGSEMKAKSSQWAAETSNPKGRRRIRWKRSFQTLSFHQRRRVSPFRTLRGG
jgi:hypothetical protein